MSTTLSLTPDGTSSHVMTPYQYNTSINTAEITVQLVVRSADKISEFAVEIILESSHGVLRIRDEDVAFVSQKGLKVNLEKSSERKIWFYLDQA